jgi:PncC family amidohydrolase
MDKAAEYLIRLLADRALYLAAAESCTAGLVADALARIPGASACFWGSFVCYTPQAKRHMLGVGEDTLNRYGAVSEETARAMALGAIEKSGADASVSVTGLAGPGGDGSNLPVGTVWIAAALRGHNMESTPAKKTIRVHAAEFHFSGSRNTIREQAAKEALIQITELLEQEKQGYALCKENSHP